MTVTSEDNVVRLVEPEDTTTDVLMEAVERGLTSVIVLGYTPEGTLYVRSSPEVTRKDALWIVEQAKYHALMVDE